MNIFLVLVIQFPLFFLPALSWAHPVNPLSLDSYTSCITGDDKTDSQECLEQLKKLDLLFLSGNREVIQDWQVDENLLLKLCKRIKEGDATALGIGFRLALVLNGESEEKLVEALGESMESEPNRFLVALQGVIDFARKGNQEGTAKKCLWDDFVSSDLGQGEKLEQQISATRKRMGVIQGIDDLSVKEAKAYVLGVLDEKIQQLELNSD